MPWKTSDLLQLREEFVKRAACGDGNVSTLCKSFGISRKTGYKWLSRYRRAEGRCDALRDDSHGPHDIPHRISQGTVERILNLRAEYGCGAKKLSVQLRQEGINVGHTTVNRVLKEHGRVAIRDRNEGAWINQVLVADDPLQKIMTDLPSLTMPVDFAEYIRRGSLRDRKKAVAVVARLKGIRQHSVAECLSLTPQTVARYASAYAAGGLSAVFPARKSRVNDEDHRGAVFALLHTPPSVYGINRTTWRMKDLQQVLSENGHPISEARIRRILKSGGFRWRRARIVLTSTDPEYQSKLAAIKGILSKLKPDEAFFSIDEYGPFAVKKKGGTKRVGPGEEYIVPQRQKSKGWMILTAALELSRNQVTHFYSLHKNTEEMIKMADVLRSQYRDCSCIYLSWDAASWHMSKKLFRHLQRLNEEAATDGFPVVKTAPLPACAQFLNVIESVFSGMARAVIHNSDYVSLEAAKEAIDRHFRERNTYFTANFRRAGCKIWGKERVPSEFSDGQNCKDPAYR